MAHLRKIKAGLVKIDIEEYIGEIGNVFFDIDTGEFRLSDGITPGGIALSGGGAIPENLSEFTNDVGFITIGDIPENVSAFINDAGYITSAAIPTNVSSFVNDSGYITALDIPETLSEFTNDVGFVVAGDLGTAAYADTGDFDASGTASGLVTAHEAALDPHPQYATDTDLTTHTSSSTAHGISAYGATLVDDANSAEARTTLELGTSSILNVPAAGDAAAGEVVKGDDSRLTDSRTPTAHTHTASQISDSSANSQSIITAVDYAAIRTLLSLGTAALEDVATFAVAIHDHTLSQISDLYSTPPETNERDADFTLAVADVGIDQIIIDDGSPPTDVACALPLHSVTPFVLDSKIPMLKENTGEFTVDAPSGVTINGEEASSWRITDQYQGAVLQNRGADTWTFSGAVELVV